VRVRQEATTAGEERYMPAQFQHGWVEVPRQTMHVSAAYGDVPKDLGVHLEEYVKKVGADGWELVDVTVVSAGSDYEMSLFFRKALESSP
jgi:hypothetical protein